MLLDPSDACVRRPGRWLRGVGRTVLSLTSRFQSQARVPRGDRHSRGSHWLAGALLDSRSNEPWRRDRGPLRKSWGLMGRRLDPSRVGSRSILGFSGTRRQSSGPGEGQVGRKEGRGGKARGGRAQRGIRPGAARISGVSRLASGSTCQEPPGPALGERGSDRRLGLRSGWLGLTDGTLRVDAGARIDFLMADRAPHPGRDRLGQDAVGLGIHWGRLRVEITPVALCSDRAVSR